MRSRRLLVAALGLIALTAAGVLTPPQQTLAAWTDAEVAKGSLTSGTVNAPTGLTCGITGVQRWVSWTAPAAGGLSRSSYHVAISGQATGTVYVNEYPTGTTQNLNPGLLSIGTYIVTVTAVGPGGWESSGITATYSLLTALITNCTVP